MEQLILAIGGILFAVVGFTLLYWLFIEIPADMARDRRRDPFAWVLISLFGSPFLAIFLLWLLGEAE